MRGAGVVFNSRYTSRLRLRGIPLLLMENGSTRSRHYLHESQLWPNMRGRHEEQRQPKATQRSQNFQNRQSVSHSLRFSCLSQHAGIIMLPISLLTFVPTQLFSVEKSNEREHWIQNNCVLICCNMYTRHTFQLFVGLNTTRRANTIKKIFVTLVN